MKYSHNQICTKDSEIEVGKQYCYRETLPTIIAEVIVLADNSSDEGIAFDLKVVRSTFFDKGYEFSIWAKAGHFAYGGMWRLWDSGTYKF